jgi:FH1/FH2 domain-containing protein 3
LSLLKRDQNVKDLKQKLINIQQSSADNPEEKSNSIEDLSGLISKAKVELERNQQRSSVKSPVENEIKKSEPKKSEIEMHWDELIENMDRPLVLNDLDFTDLTEDDDINIFAPSPKKGFIPPPPMSMNFLQNPRLSMQSDANNVVASSKFVEHISKKSKKTVMR